MKVVLEFDTDDESSISAALDLIDTLSGKGKKVDKIALARLIDGPLSTRTANTVRTFMHKNELAIESILDLEYHVLFSGFVDGSAKKEILDAVDRWWKGKDR